MIAESPVALRQSGSAALSDRDALEERLRQPFWPTDRKWLALTLLAAALAAILRSIRLMSLFPILVDEAIYLRWAEIVQHRHIWFISLLDAKPPLSTWIYAGVRLVFPDQPLLGSRIVSVIAGTLCVFVLYRIGFLLAGYRAGVSTGFLYAVLPFGVFYDRIAYVDALVNLAGACLIYAALIAFGAPTLSWRRTLMTGLVFGIGLFIKTTIGLFALAPLAIGVYLYRRSVRTLIPHIAAIYAVAALFLLWLQLAIPSGPTFATNNILLHHTSFFTPLPVLAHYPLLNLSFNAALLAGYAKSYIGYTALIAMLAAIAALLARGCYLPVVIFAACTLPFGLVLACLEYFPSRYAFPLVWPELLLLGCAAAIPVNQRRLRNLLYVATAMVFIAMAVQSARILRTPELALHESDADEFLGPGPYSGSGVLGAIAMLRSEARRGPITVLTDPWWGPPTDAVFAYLNQRGGTQVYEAWWIELEGEYPLVPSGTMPVWRSQYERVAASSVDFSSIRGLYYITDTNYHTPDEVHTGSPAARLIGHFPKRGGREFIDVYRLN